MDNSKDILLAKLISGSISNQEKNELDQFAQEDPVLQQEIDKSLRVWNQIGKLCLFHRIECRKKQDFSHVLNRVKTTSDQKSTHRKFFQARHWSAAAAAVILICLSAYLYTNTPGFGRWEAYATNDQIGNIVLPDQSSVMVNKHSKLVYLKSTNEQTRLVRLKGEAFFDVQKMNNKPFRIKAGETTIQVVGTSFNVKSDAKNHFTEVSVSEGIVTLSAKNEVITLIKGEIGQYRNGELSKISPIDHNQTYWKTGVLNFTNNSLEEVANILSNHFSEIEKVQMRAMGSDIRITTKFENQSLNELFDELALHFNKKFSFDGGILVISD